MTIDRNTALISILGLLFVFCVLLLVLKHSAKPATLLLPGLPRIEGFENDNIPDELKFKIGTMSPEELKQLADYTKQLRQFNSGRVEGFQGHGNRVEGFQGHGNRVEGFQTAPDISADVKAKLSTLKGDELDAVLDSMKAKLASYGLLPEAAAKDIDMSNYVPKSNIPPAGPRIDMSQYVKKSSIPPEKVCPPQKEIDYSQYVKKSTLPPAQKCPPCIAPKVQVSAGLCKKCPPCPSCPPPKRCPELKCPEPAPCPKVECPKCSEIKYIKVPTVITRTIKMDENNNVISDETLKDGIKLLSDLLGDGNGQNNVLSEYEEERRRLGLNKYNNNSAEEPEPTEEEVEYIIENNNNKPKVATTTTQAAVLAEATNSGYKVPKATQVQNKASKCNVVGLNSDFKKFGVYGLNG